MISGFRKEWGESRLREGEVRRILPAGGANTAKELQLLKQLQAVLCRWDIKDEERNGEARKISGIQIT